MFGQYWTETNRWKTHADMVKQYTTCVANKLHQLGVEEPTLYLDIWLSMNGRFQQRSVLFTDTVISFFLSIRQRNILWFQFYFLTSNNQYNIALFQVLPCYLFKPSLCDVIPLPYILSNFLERCRKRRMWQFSLWIFFPSKYDWW